MSRQSSILMPPTSYVQSVFLTVNTDVTNVVCPVCFPYCNTDVIDTICPVCFSYRQCWLLWNVWRQCCMFCHFFPCYDYYVIPQTLHINVGSLLIRPAIFPALFLCHQCHMSRHFTSLMPYVPPLYITHVICPAVRHQCHISWHCTSPIYRCRHYTAPV